LVLPAGSGALQTWGVDNAAKATKAPTNQVLAPKNNRPNALDSTNPNHNPTQYNPIQSNPPPPQYGTIADCYTELGDFELAAANYDKYITIMNSDGPV
jgi:hypothetical protein